MKFKSRLIFSIIGNFDPVDLSSKLALKDAKIFKKGLPLIKGKKTPLAKVNRITIQEEITEPFDLNKHVLQFLAKVPIAKVLEQKNITNLSLTCEISADDGGALRDCTLILEKKALAVLSESGIVFQLEAYIGE